VVKVVWDGMLVGVLWFGGREIGWWRWVLEEGCYRCLLFV
jgi:hypothetical protein